MVKTRNMHNIFEKYTLVEPVFKTTCLGDRTSGFFVPLLTFQNCEQSIKWACCVLSHYTSVHYTQALSAAEYGKNERKSSAV